MLNAIFVPGPPPGWLREMFRGVGDALVRARDTLSDLLRPLGARIRGLLDGIAGGRGEGREPAVRLRTSEDPGLRRTTRGLARALRSFVAAGRARLRRGSVRLRRWLRGGSGRFRAWLQRTAAAAGPRFRAAMAAVGPRLRSATATIGPRLRSATAAVGPRLRSAMAAGGLRLRNAAAALGPRLRAGARWSWRHRPSARQTAAIAVITFIAGWVLWERCGVGGCPDVERLGSYQPGGSSVLVDRSGEEFARLAPMEYEVVALDSLPPHVAEAFVAVEDRRFWEHGGVDWLRSLGALAADVRAGRLAQGASTIPMQLSRTLFPERIRREEKTLRRKLLEVRMAREIEDRFSKREILELYLNHVYLGGGSYGVQAASRYWLGKPATELSVPEAALLAALPRAPSHYDPRRYPERAKARRDLVLGLMERQDMLAVDAAQEARETELAVAAEPDRDRDGDRLAPWFVEAVRSQLSDALGERLYMEPLRVLTTLDVPTQLAAEEELEEQLRSVERGWFGWYQGDRYGEAEGPPGGEDIGYVQGAAVFMDPRSGDVRAWVGGRDHDQSRYDRARLAKRQAGSAFKPFVYAAALETGLAPSQPILDAPYRLARGGSRVWQPENYDGTFRGPMSMREALTRSQNIPAVRVAAAVGDDPIRQVAARAGIDGEVPASPVAALGVTVVSPLQMATAFAAFATLGERPEPRLVLRVETEDGEVLWASEPPRTTRAMDPAVAYILTDMLRDVVDRGTGASVRRVGYRGPAAGKTGTTSDATDVWFVGYTPEIVGAVWVGYDEVRPLPRGATGGGVAAPIWGRVMARVDDGASSGWPERPPGVVALRTDPETGMTLKEGCYTRWGQARTELFLERAVPSGVCPRRYEYERRRSRWWGRLFGSSRDDRPRIPGRTDPDLGLPRLPVREAAPERQEAGGVVRLE